MQVGRPMTVFLLLPYLGKYLTRLKLLPWPQGIKRGHVQVPMEGKETSWRAGQIMSQYHRRPIIQVLVI